MSRTPEWKPCTGCSRCCRTYPLAESHAYLFEQAGIDTTEDGACQHLVPHEDGSGHCAIYEDRPWFCRVSDALDFLAGREGYTRAEYEASQIADCNRLMERAGMGKMWRIKETP